MQRRCRDAEVQKCRGAGLQGCRVAGLQVQKRVLRQSCRFQRRRKVGAEVQRDAGAKVLSRYGGANQVQEVQMQR